MGFHFYFLMEKVVLLHSLGWQPGIQLNTNQAKLKAFCSNIWLVWEVWVINGTRCKKKKSYKKVATVLRQMPLLLFLMFPPHCEKFSHAYWWTIFFQHGLLPVSKLFSGAGPLALLMQLLHTLHKLFSSCELLKHSSQYCFFLLLVSGCFLTYAGLAFSLFSKSCVNTG